MKPASERVRSQTAAFFGDPQRKLVLHATTFGKAKSFLHFSCPYSSFVCSWSRVAARPRSPKSALKRLWNQVSITHACFFERHQFRHAFSYSPADFENVSAHPVLIVLSGEGLGLRRLHGARQAFPVENVAGFVRLTPAELKGLCVDFNKRTRAGESVSLPREAYRALYVKAFKWLSSGARHDPRRGWRSNRFWRK